MEELIARIRALPRRAEDQRTVGFEVIVRSHQVDLIARTIVRTPETPQSAPGAVHLTKTECAVIEVLARNPGRVVPNGKILQDVWRAQSARETGNLRFSMARLHKKLELEPGGPRQLITETGLGYRFQLWAPRSRARVRRIRRRIRTVRRSGPSRRRCPAGGGRLRWRSRA